jgi:hypothetical protein
MPMLRGSTFWHEKAKECRTLAQELSDPESKKTMSEITTDYERLEEAALELERAGAKLQQRLAAISIVTVLPKID